MPHGAGRKHFIRTLTHRFPEIIRRIDQSARGLLHCEMGYFACATQKALEEGDEALVRAHFEIADELLAGAGAELANALIVSYLEYIDFNKDYPKRVEARKLLSVRLRDALAGLEFHWAEIELRLKKRKPSS